MDANQWKEGLAVKIVCSIDTACLAHRIGQTGRIIATGDENMGMFDVEFSDGYIDDYWPEELELA